MNVATSEIRCRMARRLRSRSPSSGMAAGLERLLSPARAAEGIGQLVAELGDQELVEAVLADERIAQWLFVVIHRGKHRTLITVAELFQSL